MVETSVLMEAFAQLAPRHQLVVDRFARDVAIDEAFAAQLGLSVNGTLALTYRACRVFREAVHAPTG